MNAMNNLISLFLVTVLISMTARISAQESKPGYFSYNNSTYPLYPETLEKQPQIPSPVVLEDGLEVITVITGEGKYQLLPVTVENKGTLNYKESQWYAKGEQLVADTADFPALAASGLHSEKELGNTQTITGKNVDDITGIARPQNYSGIGFIADDEDIISVLEGDNMLVRKLGLTHPGMAKTLFHVFNIMITVKTDSKRGNVSKFLYNGKVVDVKFWGSKGWQESIFNDEILGYWKIEISRNPERSELEFLSMKYRSLSEEQMAVLIKKLSFIHTGEMVPFYIMRYGFYEGHTGYRADPIALAFIFGLKSIEEIENSFPGKLFEALTQHHTVK